MLSLPDKLWSKRAGRAAVTARPRFPLETKQMEPPRRQRGSHLSVPLAPGGQSSELALPRFSVCIPLEEPPPKGGNSGFDSRPLDEMRSQSPARTRVAWDATPRRP
jgi:hypothetical protein